ncbi:hypothetical protein [Polaribacter sp.]|uniref:hypothetical protein n=1 Tax=Polaribacter sp. TaxID=1920175 RepID=UPI0025CE9BB5|nr:hypothetical protein [Polaribacter sp.]
MKILFSCFLVVFLMGCKSQDFSLVKENKLQLNEGFFKEISPAIADEDTYIQVNLNFNQFDTAKIKLLAIYFRNQIIPSKVNEDTFSISGSINKELTLIENVEFPFELKANEVVLSYKKKNKTNYAKYAIVRKISMDDIPR